MYKEKSNCCSCIFNIISSLLVATGIAAVFFAGLVTSIQTLIYITLILGILGLITSLALVFCGRKHFCNCINSTNIITSSVGAIISSAFALAITSLEIASIPVAILIGVVAFFLVSLTIDLIEILVCFSCNTKNCCYKD